MRALIAALQCSKVIAHSACKAIWPMAAVLFYSKTIAGAARCGVPVISSQTLLAMSR
jgi:hypothetical protein